MTLLWPHVVLLNDMLMIVHMIVQVDEVTDIEGGGKELTQYDFFFLFVKRKLKIISFYNTKKKLG